MLLVFKIISCIDYRNIDFRGIDLKPIIHFIFNIEDDQINSFVGNTSTFLVAYGFHKLMAPLRFPITAGVVPFLVKLLRRIGFLKPPKNIEKIRSNNIQ